MSQEAENNNLSENSTFKTLRHDIKNQLSNIHLALEQLRYEFPEASTDILFYMDTIQISCNRINTLLHKPE